MRGVAAADEVETEGREGRREATIVRVRYGDR